MNTIMECVDRIRDTANSHERIFFIEVMGRDAGFLASSTGVGAIEAIKQGQRNVMVGYRNNDIVHVPFSECIRTDKRFDKRLITVLNELSI